MREKILSVIEKNSRMSMKDLAAILGEDQSLVENEIKKMEKEKVICGYHTLINWDEVDVEKVNAVIEVNVTPKRDLGFDEIAEKIYNYPEVTSVYLLSGSFDLLVNIEGKTLREVALFVSQKLSTLESVVGCKTNFVLKKYKDHGTIFEKEIQDERIQMLP